MKVNFNYVTPKNMNSGSYSNKSDVNFGFSFSRGAAKSSHKLSSRLMSEAGDISGYFFTNNEADILDLLKLSGKKQRKFLRVVARRYSEDNYYTEPNQRESVENVINVFKSVKKPNKYHYFVLSNIKGTFSQIENILKGINKHNFVSIDKLNKKISGNSSYSDTLISDLFSSPNKNEYLKHFDKYSSYFALNKENKNAVAELDELLKLNTYNQNSYDSKYFAKNIKSYSRLKDNKFITEEFLEKHYSASAESFINDFLQTYLPHRTGFISIDNSFDIMQMYKTANPENLNLRYRIMQYFKFSTMDRHGNNNFQSEITEMRKLFEKIDNNKYVADFIKKFISVSSNIHSIKTLNNLLDAVGAKKADIFFNNFIRLVNKAPLEEQISALEKGIENPFYETKYMKYRRRTEEHYKFRKPLSRYSKAAIVFGNFVNKVKYKLLPEETVFVPINSLAEGEGYKPAELAINTANSFRTELLTDETTPAVNLVSSLKLSPKARKLTVIKDINDVITKELSSKTLQKQSEAYKAGATSMRLKLLPEIFASIKETRRTDLSVGKRKGYPISSDALSLYSRINGKNRKLVRYLLTKRNADNSRMFEVKDIVAIINNAENKIKQNNYSPAEAKKYYEKLYQANLQMYGKPNLRKKSIFAKSTAISQPVTANKLKQAV